MQTRLQSMIEAVANVLVGYLVAVGSQMILFPLFDIERVKCKKADQRRQLNDMNLKGNFGAN